MTSTAVTPSSILSDLNELWGVLDRLFGTLGPDDWSRNHGNDWTFADVPYHISYFDNDLVVEAIKVGSSLPAAEQVAPRTLNELNAWNEQKFAERPSEETPQQSLERMEASREAIRELASTMSEADLDGPAWLPLPGVGMTTVRMALEGCRTHTWSHAMELRMRLGLETPIPSDAITHAALGFNMQFFAAIVDHDSAAGRDFNLVMDFTGPGGGAWTQQVHDGGCTVIEGRSDDADLVMTQSVETFVKMSLGMQNPMLAMLTRKIKPSSYRKLPTFMKLFPQPKPDQEIASLIT